MKRLIIPRSTYWFTDADACQTSILSRFNAGRKVGKKMTLLGAFKMLRVMPSFAALGDYVLLSQSVDFFRKNSLKFSKRDLRLCLNRFEDYSSRTVAINRNFVDALLN